MAYETRVQEPHEVGSTVQKGLGLGTTRGAPVVYTTVPSDCKVGKQIDCRDLVHLMNGTCHEGSSSYCIAGSFHGVQILFFLLSVYQNENLTHEMYVMMCMCKMDRTKIKHTNQLEITQNEIWTPRKFPAIGNLIPWNAIANTLQKRHFGRKPL